MGEAVVGFLIFQFFALFQTSLDPNLRYIDYYYYIRSSIFLLYILIVDTFIRTAVRCAKIFSDSWSDNIPLYAIHVILDVLGTFSDHQTLIRLCFYLA